MTEAETIDILLVEDDPTDAHLLTSLLDHADVCTYRLRQAGSAADAERLLANDRYDVVLLDISLPDCDGLVSVQRVLAVAPTTPIVVLTGRDDYELGLQSIEAGAQDFLVKGEVKGNTILRCAKWSIARAAVGTSAAASAGDQRWTVVERTLAPMAVIDRELKMVTTNRAFVDLLGRPAAELAQLSLTEFVDVDDIVEFVLGLRATLREEATNRQVDVRVKTGRDTWTPGRLNFARIVPIGDEEPSLLLMMSPLE